MANLRNLAIAELRAATDVLTGLPNNRALQGHAKRMFAHASRTSTSLGVAILDLDHFKQINDNSGAKGAAEKIREAVAKLKIVGVERAITASIGVAAMPDDGADITTLTRNADRALYAAKAGGRNRVESFTHESGNGVPPQRPTVPDTSPTR